MGEFSNTSGNRDVTWGVVIPVVPRVMEVQAPMLRDSVSQVKIQVHDPGRYSVVETGRKLVSIQY